MNKVRNLLYAACLVLFSNEVFATGNVILPKGSDTLLVVAQAWAQAYDRVNPVITVSVGGGGSGTGFDALLNGPAMARVARRCSSRSRRSPRPMPRC